jgi:hypothetical protein
MKLSREELDPGKRLNRMKKVDKSISLREK